MTTFSANLGFLWADRALPDAVRAAAAAGFDAVELHWPYDVDPVVVRGALDEVGLPVLGLNAPRGDVGAGDNGLAGVPGREEEARSAVVQALDYAEAIGARNVHVLAGFAAGPEAHRTYVAHLRWAAEAAADRGRTILIEPLNHYDAPGYLLSTSAQAAAVVREVDRPALRIMFDAYHVQLMEGDLTHRLAELLPLIGHVQVAAVPDRGAPDHGEVDFRHVFATLDGLGWSTPVGAEYRPDGDTDASLGWLRDLRS